MHRMVVHVQYSPPFAHRRIALDAASSTRTAMRMVMPIALIAAVAVVGAALMVMTHEGSTPVAKESRPLPPSASKAPVQAAPSAVLQSTSKPSARPMTPVYAPLPAEPQAIYRCRSGAGTTYSNEPCVGGKVVEQASAVDGYDTRPSAGMTQLVEQGRAAPDPIARRERVLRPYDDVALARSAECATFAQQIRDIDGALLRRADSRDYRERDELRQRRQDIRSSQARSHC